MNERAVQVREVGLRDGLQMVTHLLPKQDKIDWLKAEAALGVQSFDVTSFVSRAKMPQFADAEEMLQACQEMPGIQASVLTLNAALAGLGGCPFAPGASGNVATEDLVYLLEGMGLSTGIDLPGLLGLRERLAQWLPRVNLYGNLARAGLPKDFELAA